MIREMSDALSQEETKNLVPGQIRSLFYGEPADIELQEVEEAMKPLFDLVPLDGPTASRK